MLVLLISTVNALISAHGHLDFLCALGWALIRDVRQFETCANSRRAPIRDVRLFFGIRKFLVMIFKNATNFDEFNKSS